MWLNDKQNDFNKNYYRNNKKNNNNNNDSYQLIMFENQNVSTTKSNLILSNLIINENYYNKNNYFISTIQVKRKS